MINAQIRDDDFLPFILGKMMGKMLLIDNFTEHDEIEMYRNTDHVNYFIPSGDGFLCVSIFDEFVMIPFAWHTGKRSTLKEMVRLGKDLYIHYTLEQNKPIYYSGLKNFYNNHSRKIADDVWVFEPKV